MHETAVPETLSSDTASQFSMVKAGISVKKMKEEKPFIILYYTNSNSFLQIQHLDSTNNERHLLSHNIAVRLQQCRNYKKVQLIP